MRQRRQQRPASTRPRWVSESRCAAGTRQWPVVGGQWPELVPTRSENPSQGPRPKAQDPRPKTARIRFRAVPTLPEAAAPLVGRVKRVDAASCRVRSVQVAVRGTSMKRQDAASTTGCVSSLLALSADVSPARGGDMPRGMAGAWHVTRGPIPRGPKNGMGDRASQNARSPGGLLGRYRRGLRALRQNGGLRRTEGDSPIFAAAALSGCGTSHVPRKLGQSPCPSGSRKPRLSKEQPAVAGIRACLPAALVVGRISIRLLKRRTDGEIRPAGSGPT